MPEIQIVLPDGTIGAIDESELPRYRQYGARLATPEDVAGRSVEAELEREYGDRPFSAGALGLARGLTLGGSDVLADQFGYDVTAREVRERNPVVSGVTEVVGAVAPAVASGGASAAGTAGRAARALSATPAGRAASLGAALGQRAGGGFLARTGGMAAEGAIVGAGAGVSELALSEQPVTAERAMSVLSSNALLGAGIGAGASVIGKAAEMGLARARSAVESVAERARAPQASSPIVDRVTSYQTARRPVFTITKGEGKAVLAKQARTIRDALDAPVELGRRPGRLLVPLEKETKVLRELVEEGEESILERLAESDRKVIKAVFDKLDDAKPGATSIKLDKKLAAEYRDVVGIPGRGGLKLPIDEAQRFLGAVQRGELTAARRQAIAEVPALLDENLALAESIRTTIDAGARGERGILEQAAMPYAISAMTGILPGGPLGAIGAVAAPRIASRLAELVTGRLGKAAAEAAERTAQAIDTILDVGAKAGRVAVPAATRVLSSVRYAPPQEAKRPEAPARSPLIAAFRERERELRSQITTTPDGQIVMSPRARAELGERLKGVRAVDPLLADQIETHTVRRVEFLARKLPRRPDTAAIQVGPDRWEPSEFQVRQFARFAAAVEDPGAVEERVAEGTVTPEDAEVLREVYPQRFADLQQQLMLRLPELRQTLPYKRRLALSILFGVPVDPAMDPRILAVLQATYAAEDGTEGGTQAPSAQPQFGSLGSVPGTEPTQAQERAAR